MGRTDRLSAHSQYLRGNISSREEQTFFSYSLQAGQPYVAPTRRRLLRIAKDELLQWGDTLPFIVRVFTLWEMKAREMNAPPTESQPSIRAIPALFIARELEEQIRDILNACIGPC